MEILVEQQVAVLQDMVVEVEVVPVQQDLMEHQLLVEQVVMEFSCQQHSMIQDQLQVIQRIHTHP
jgi:hypothetical protein